MSDVYLTTFYRYCVRCSLFVPEDRLRRGADTCSTVCKNLDRREQRKYQKAHNLDRMIKSAKARRMVRDYATDERRTAPHPPDSEAGVVQSKTNHSEQEQVKT